MKKILILSDYPDLVRYQKIYHLTTREIYVVLFLLDHFTKDNSTVIHLNDRSGISYHSLWKEESPLCHYIDRFLVHKPWEALPFTEYDLIICHFDYDVTLDQYLSERYRDQYDKSNIYSLVNPRHKSASSIFPYIDNLFCEGGMFEVTHALKTGALLAFKKEFVQGYIGSRREEHEKMYHDLLIKITAVNKSRQHIKFKKVLILDDYKRNFYIGDTTVWARFFRKALRYCGDYEEVVINCNNPKTFPLLRVLYEHAFGKNVTISAKPWEQIDLSAFDLVILETDLVLKFLLYITPFYDTQLSQVSIYTITPLREGIFQDVYNWEFYSNHKVIESAEAIARKDNIDKEIFVSIEEMETAHAWLEKHGVRAGDNLIVIQNSSAKDKKVIRFEEFIAFIKKLIQGEGVKILLFDDALLVSGYLTAAEKNKVIFATGLGIRKDMCLMASKYTKAIIGPCTGMLHLSNGVITYLVNHGFRKKEDIPFILVYTGRQEHDIGYLPRNWWYNSLAECAVVVKEDEGHTLLTLEESPDNSDTYNAVAGEVQCITAEMLFAFFVLNFRQLKFPATHQEEFTGYK